MKLNIKIGQIIEVYTNLDEDAFGLGKVLNYDEEYLLIQELSVFGEQDGVVLYKTDSVFKIAYDTIYSRKILKLAKLLKEKEENYEFAGDFPISILEASRREKKVIDIQLCDSGRCDVSGVVDSIQDGICVIRQITSEAEEDGFCCVKVEDITSIRYDSSDNRKIEEKIKMN